MNLHAATYVGIIPALAGNTAAKGAPHTDPPDHPRSRGEYIKSYATVRDCYGSSPLSRGIRSPDPQRVRHQRIIPALAGNTSRILSIPRCRWDHPRSRGEYSLHWQTVQFGMGSSPLSRGIQRPPRQAPHPRRIIPALAGNTDPPRRGASSRPDHPRSRGEYAPRSQRSRTARGSSPLSRGIRGGGGDVGHLDRIIPALAGNTPFRPPPDGQGSDHPRSRGEYYQRARKGLTDYGSSPLSRGILQHLIRDPSARGIIPALAGNTPSRHCQHP